MRVDLMLQSLKLCLLLQQFIYIIFSNQLPDLRRHGVKGIVNHTDFVSSLSIIIANLQKLHVAVTEAVHLLDQIIKMLCDIAYQSIRHHNREEKCSEKYDGTVDINGKDGAVHIGIRRQTVVIPVIADIGAIDGKCIFYCKIFSAADINNLIGSQRFLPHAVCL